MTKALNMAFKPNASTTFNVRMFEIDGEPWFVAADACRALGLNLKGGTSNHLKKLDADERRPVPLNLVQGNGRGMAQATLISEAGLYKLIAKSDKPAAKAFDRWVRHEVLPATRLNGTTQIEGEEGGNGRCLIIGLPARIFAPKQAGSLHLPFPAPVATVDGVRLLPRENLRQAARSAFKTTTAAKRMVMWLASAPTTVPDDRIHQKTEPRL